MSTFDPIVLNVDWSLMIERHVWMTDRRGTYAALHAVDLAQRQVEDWMWTRRPYEAHVTACGHHLRAGGPYLRHDPECRTCTKCVKALERERKRLEGPPAPAWIGLLTNLAVAIETSEVESVDDVAAGLRSAANAERDRTLY